MKKILWLVVLWLIIFSSVCYAHDVIEVGGTLSSAVISDDTFVGGGLNLAFFPEISNSFGMGIFINISSVGAIDVLTGLCYEFYISDKFSLPVSAGLLVGIPFCGFGGNITARYEFHPNLAIYGRIQCAYAFVIFFGTETFIISPCIGLGLRF